MIKVEIKGLVKTLAHIAGMQKQMKFATALALTRAAMAVKDALPAVMDRTLDRPTPFTKRGIFVMPAKRDNLKAVVGFMDRQASYLKFQIAGGTRTPTSRGIKLPGNIILNSFGNIPKGLIEKLKQSAQDGTLGRGVAGRLGLKNRRKNAAPIELFYGKPTGRGWDNAPMGIWRRVPGSPGKLIPVIVFEDSPAHYKPRFHFTRAAANVVRRVWDATFAAALNDALRTAK